MKTIASIALISLLCCCKTDIKQANSSPATYKVIGAIKNMPANWVYMRTMKRDAVNNLYWPIIDSAKVTNGKFTLQKDTLLADPSWSTNLSYKDTVTQKTVSIAFINKYKSAKGKAEIIGDFILENAKIEISGDKGIDRAMSIQGSKETDFLMKYGLISPPASKKTDDLKKYKANFRKIIIENPSTSMALLNTYQNSHYFNPSELEEFASIFDKNLLKSPLGLKFGNYIKQSKLLRVSGRFPDFNYVNAKKQRFTLKDVKGKNATLVIFWASWCVPCRAEIPELKAIYSQYKNKEVALVSISIDHNVEEWEKALDNEKMPWSNLSNLPGDHKAVTSRYNIMAIPAIFLLDKNNKILLSDVNDLTLIKEKIENLIEKGT
jgi:thiol-disulfide isomerase/thioredoxin